MDLRGLRGWSPFAPGCVAQALDIDRARLGPAGERLRRTVDVLLQKRADDSSPTGRVPFPVVLSGGPDWLPGVLLTAAARPAAPGSRGRASPAILGALSQALGLGSDGLRDLSYEVVEDPDPAQLPRGLEVQGGSDGGARLLALASALSGVHPGHRVVSACLRLERERWVLTPIRASTLSDKVRITNAEAPAARRDFLTDTPRDPGDWLDGCLGAGWRGAARRALEEPLRAALDSGWAHYCAHRFPAARTEYERAAAIAVGRGDLLGLGQAIEFSANCRLRSGDFLDGIAHLRAARAVLESLAQRADIGAQVHLGTLDAFLGSALGGTLQHVQARTLLEAARQNVDAIDADPGRTDLRLTRLALGGTLAQTLRAFGKLDQAASLLEACLDLDLRQEEARTRGNLADTLRRGGALADAEAELGRAEEALEQLDDEHYQEGCRQYLEWHRARLLLDQKRDGEARERALRGAGWARPATTGLWEGLLGVRVGAGDPEAEAEAAAALRGGALPLFGWILAEPVLARWERLGTRPDLEDATRGWLERNRFELSELDVARRQALEGSAAAARLLAVRLTH